MANHTGISFFKDNVMYQESCIVFTELVDMKLDKSFQQNYLKEQERRGICGSVWVCCIITNSVMCILSGFPWHTPLGQMDNLQNCLDSLLLDVTTKIFLAVEGL